jgi:hypothetical protein
MRVPVLMAAICLTTLSACAQPAPGYGEGAPPPGYGQGGTSYAQNAPPQGAPQGAPGYGGGWAGGMQGAGGQDQSPPQSGYSPPAPPMGQPGAESGGGGHRGQFRAKFEEANVTHDGRLTQQQAQAGGMKAVARNFAQIDRDQKGYVTEQDIKAWRHEKHAEKVQAKQSSQGYPPPAPAGGYGQAPANGQQY